MQARADESAVSITDRNLVEVWKLASNESDVLYCSILDPRASVLQDLGIRARESRYLSMSCLIEKMHEIPRQWVFRIADLGHV